MPDSLISSLPFELNKAREKNLRAAAAILGMTLEEYLFQQLVTSPERVIESSETTLLSDEAWGKLNKTIEYPPEPTPALKNLMQSDKEHPNE